MYYILKKKESNLNDNYDEGDQCVIQFNSGLFFDIITLTNITGGTMMKKHFKGKQNDYRIIIEVVD